MKAINLFAVMLVFAVNTFAADALTERLQRGLFEEEANRNLDAAIKEYQSVVTQADEQRKVVATALFRLGECYRKLGRTNEAAAFYQRITRDYSEQEQLAKLASDFLKPAVVNAASGNQSEYVRQLQSRIATLKVQSIEQQMDADRLASLSRAELLNTPAITNFPDVFMLRQQQLALVLKLADLRTQFGEQHPEVKAKQALRETIDAQLDSAVEGVATSARRRAETLAAQLKALGDELKKAENAEGSIPRPTAETTSLTQAEAEELARVKTLARNSPDLLRAPSNGFTELQRAARSGHYSVVEFLLSQDVKPEDPAPGYTPLDEAARRGHLRIVQLLLEKGATTEDAGKSLISACESGYKSVAEVLIARGADVNRRTSLNLTPLHFAAYGGHLAIAEMLLKRGAQLEVLSTGNNKPQGWPDWVTRGATPLHLAVNRGHAILAAQLIAAGAKADATNSEKRTPLHLAAMNGNTNLCALLLDHGANPNAATTTGETPLGNAIVSGTATDVLSQLLRRGADVDLPGFNYNGYGLEAPVLVAMRRGSVEVMRVLLAARPKLEVKSRDGLPPLQETVRNDQEALAILLLEAGADPNGRYDNNGQTPLHLAVRGRPNLVAALLRHGANPNVLTRQGETPLSLALNALRQSDPPGLAQPGLPGRPIRVVGGPAGNSEQTAAYEVITELLRAYGADEFLQRRGFISAVRGSERRVNIFSKGTNDLNRYTLMEFLAAVYEQGGGDFAFPDFAKITIHRVATWKGPVTNVPPGAYSVNAMATVNTKTPILVNFAALLAATNCAGDVPLEWGDEVEIPMADHSVSAQWPGMIGRYMAAPPPGYADNQPSQGQEVFNQCLQRTVRFTAGGTNVTFDLLPAFADLRRGSLGSPRSPFFRLSNVVLRDSRFRNLLRSSSDLSRVTVTRTDPQSKESKKMTLDLNAVALPDMSYSSGNQPPIPWTHDLWLRDGDVIEVPEKP